MTHFLKFSTCFLSLRWAGCCDSLHFKVLPVGNYEEFWHKNYIDITRLKTSSYTTICPNLDDIISCQEQ